MSFVWDDDLETVWGQGMADYTVTVLDTLYALCTEYAGRIQDWMRTNAPWQDTCLPNREYLVAVATRDDTDYTVGIRCYYDLEIYRAQCGEPPFNWAGMHEFSNFSKAGPISIIVPGGTPRGALGDLVDELWDRIRALFS